MGSCGETKTKNIQEEENKKKEEEDKSKNKEVSKEEQKDKEKDKEKEKDQSKKVDSKSNNKEEKLTNPIINQNNLQPNKDNTITRHAQSQQNQIHNKIESQKIFTQSNAQLPSAILKNNIEGTSNVTPMNINKNLKSKKDQKTSAKEENLENEEEKSELAKNEHLIAPMEGQLFQKIMTDNQMKNLEIYNTNFYPKGEHIILSFGDSFDLFNDFFTTLFSEHQLYKEQPIYNYNTFFENEDNYEFKGRGIAFNIPNDYYEIYLKSDINSLYNNSNIIFNTNKKSRNDIDINTMNNMTSKQFLNMNEKSDDFIKQFNNDSNTQKLNNILTSEAEKCSHLRCLHFLGNVFDGSSMGILCRFINDIQEDYKKVLKLTHLKYFDSLEHKAFNKIKNYIYTISSLYNKCDLVNFFNSTKGGDILSCITAGERINEYSSGYSVNQILADLLVDPKNNYIYSNGLEIKEKDCDEKYIEILFQDCKEDKHHNYYKPQMSSLTIYKGNKTFDNDSKFKLSDEISKIVDKHILNNRAYYNFYDINKNFEINDFLANLHQSQYFTRYTEEFFMNFIQNYNIGNFSYPERQLREETINNVHGILNSFKEIWRYKV